MCSGISKRVEHGRESDAGAMPILKGRLMILSRKSVTTPVRCTFLTVLATEARAYLCHDDGGRGALASAATVCRVCRSLVALVT